MVEQYIQNTQNVDRIQYEHPDLEPILKSTKGVMIYQEQIQKTAQQFAGYSLAEADNIRRVIGKKKPADMAKLKPEFIQRSVQKGYDAQFADHIFEMMSAFAAYGFNRPHSGTYSELAVQTMWLKIYYPAEYMAAYISSRSDQEEIVAAIHECKRMGIPVVPPDINRSSNGFTVETLADGRKAIRMGFLCISGVGEKVVNELLNKQPFADLVHFYNTIDRRTINKSSVSTLIKAGCFDNIEPNRHSLLNKYFFELRDDKQESLKTMQRYPEDGYTREIRLQFELDLLGMYVSGHPVDHLPYRPWHLVGHNQNLEIAGVITALRNHKDKNGNAMAFLTLDTVDGARQVIAFNTVFKSAEKLLAKGKVVVVKGKKDAEKNSIISSKFIAPEKFAKTIKTIDMDPVPIRDDPMCLIDI